MFRIWGKLIKNNKFVDDMVYAIENNSMDRGIKIRTALDEFCMAFDLQVPMWFDKNTKEMDQFRRTTFHSDQFIESITFDYLEIEIIEDDNDDDMIII